MSLSELADWMSRALCDVIVVPIGHIDEPPFGAVHRAYKELDPVVRTSVFPANLRSSHVAPGECPERLTCNMEAPGQPTCESPDEGIAAFTGQGQVIDKIEGYR